MDHLSQFCAAEIIANRKPENIPEGDIDGHAWCDYLRKYNNPEHWSCCHQTPEYSDARDCQCSCHTVYRVEGPGRA